MALKVRETLPQVLRLQYRKLQSLMQSAVSLNDMSAFMLADYDPRMGKLRFLCCVDAK